VNILIIGSGGREHAIAWKLNKSSRVNQLYCAPGNAGTAGLCRNITHDLSREALLQFCIEQKIDLVVVGPEAPLCEGVADWLEAGGVSVVGPSAAAAQLEGSKVFAKDFMLRHNIPTGRYHPCVEPDQAEDALKRGLFGFPIVVKADGLAAGKGVFICRTLEEALDAVNAIMRERCFGPSGDRLILEEFLEGEEASFMCLTDGDTVLPLVPSQDHKAIYEGDKGPNTGGMGAYSMNGLLPEELQEQIMSEIMLPTIRGMAMEETPFKGILYAGLMLTGSGPQVLEFNVRFGDPETQAVLPRMESDLAEVFELLSQGKLTGTTLQWSDQAAVCVVIASGGYPGPYETGKEISGIEMAEEEQGTVVFHAGTREENGKILTTGGRVLGVTATAASLEHAIMKAYEGVNKIHFDGMYYRRDIASRGLSKIGRA